jgi:leucyl aminopeptidase
MNKAITAAATALSVFSLLFASLAGAHTPTKPILADLRDLKALGIPVKAQDDRAEVGYAEVSEETLATLQEKTHYVGKCGGFEDLSGISGVKSSASFTAMVKHLGDLVAREQAYSRAPFRPLELQKDAAIEAALNEVSEDNLRATVTWLSSYPNRFNRASQPNIHVEDMKKRLQDMMAGSKFPFEINLIDHRQTSQKSVQLRLIGSERPNEIVVMGAHLDSINMSWSGERKAPGADDNASGSANLIEALRILLTKSQPKRTIEFYWYAGEESGLLGSAEIAQDYKNAHKDVVAVLQLDMTLFPGNGELVIGNMTDFTSSWMRDYLKAMNDTYLHARLAEDRCGYGCSDHASWFRQGYATLMPFEATMDTMNGNIHTANDVMTSDSDFKHSAVYTKIALVIGMDLANGTQRPPLQ